MADKPELLQPGDKIGQYEITHVLGRGGMGAMYAAVQPILDRRVAIKMPLRHEEDERTKALHERIIQEARLMSRLTHPGIPMVFDVGEHEGLPYLATEFVKGISLTSIVDKEDEFPLQVVLKIMVAIAGIMQYAHDNQVAHKDIKPDNIVIRKNGQPVMVDFGIAAPSGGDPLAKPGQAIGTPAFMAPEQITDGKTSDHLSDIWGLGATFFYTFTGERLYEGNSVQDILEQILAPDPPDLSALKDAVPEFVFDIISRCLQKDRSKRYQSCGELKQALEAAVDNLERSQSQTLVLETPHAGQTILLNVEYREAGIPGDYRQYEFGDFIGEGSYGKVFRAAERLTGKDMALKILKKEWVSDEETVTRFRREAAILARFDHPNILKVFNFGRYGASFFIAMELTEGKDLEEKLKQTGPMALPDAVRIMSEIFEGLDAIHQEGIIHRDLKPQNIAFKDEKAIICDFGISHAEDFQKLTMTGKTVGTPRYFSPEQASGGEIGAPSDVYSAGVILYELLTNTIPHEDTTIYQLLIQIADAKPTPITDHRDDLPKEISKFFDKVLTKSPKDRPSAREARALLQNL